MSYVFSLNDSSVHADRLHERLARGRLSGADLWRADATIFDPSDRDIEAIRAICREASSLFSSQGVPDRTVRVRESSSTVSDGVTTAITLELSEVERYPDTKQLELDGRVYDVVGYREAARGDDVIREAVVAVDDAGLERLQDLPATVSVRRVGFDDETSVWRVAGYREWSKAPAGSPLPYYQSVYLVSSANPPVRGLTRAFASGVTQQALVRLVFELQLKVEALTNELAEVKALDADAVQRVTAATPSLAGESERNAYFRSLTLVPDVMEAFEDKDD